MNSLTCSRERVQIKLHADTSTNMLSHLCVGITAVRHWQGKTWLFSGTEKVISGKWLCPAIISLTKCLCQVCYYCHACVVPLDVFVFVAVLTTVPPTFSPWFCEACQLYFVLKAKSTVAGTYTDHLVPHFLSKQRKAKCKVQRYLTSTHSFYKCLYADTTLCFCFCKYNLHWHLIIK